MCDEFRQEAVASFGGGGGSKGACLDAGGGVEILYIPRYQARAFDMFTDRMEDLAAERIGELVRDGVLFKRPSKTGSFSWGEKNRLAVHTRSGIPVDLFAATE